MDSAASAKKLQIVGVEWQKALALYRQVVARNLLLLLIRKQTWNKQDI
jgi:hypothetical protein